MNPIFAAALEVQSYCEARGFRFCLIGGVAVQRWGEPRLTVAVDLTAFEPKPGLRLTTCSAEDLIVHKAFADRAKDWLDVEGVAARQAGRLDESLILAELAPLLELKGTPVVADRLRRVLQAARGRDPS